MFGFLIKQWITYERVILHLRGRNLLFFIIFKGKEYDLRYEIIADIDKNISFTSTNNQSHTNSIHFNCQCLQDLLCSCYLIINRTLTSPILVYRFYIFFYSLSNINIVLHCNFIFRFPYIMISYKICAHNSDIKLVFVLAISTKIKDWYIIARNFRITSIAVQMSIDTTSIHI